MRLNDPDTPNEFALANLLFDLRRGANAAHQVIDALRTGEGEPLDIDDVAHPASTLRGLAALIAYLCDADSSALKELMTWAEVELPDPPRTLTLASEVDVGDWVDHRGQLEQVVGVRRDYFGYIEFTLDGPVDPLLSHANKQLLTAHPNTPD